MNMISVVAIRGSESYATALFSDGAELFLDSVFNKGSNGGEYPASIKTVILISSEGCDLFRAEISKDSVDSKGDLKTLLRYWDIVKGYFLSGNGKDADFARNIFCEVSRKDYERLQLYASQPF